MIKWAGVSNSEIGIVVEHYPRPVLPERKQEVKVIHGGNGDAIITTKGFKNYDQPYSVFLEAKDIGGLERVMPKLADWLLGNEGYHRLEDSYFPDVYRMAYYSGGTEFISIFNEYGEGTLTFNCAPKKYYKTGDYAINVANGTKLYNPSAFDAEPLIYISGTGTCGLWLNESVQGSNGLTISSLGNKEIILDIEKHRIYDSDGNEYSDLLSGRYEDLILTKESTFHFSGSGVSSVQVKPRWWTV